MPDWKELVRRRLVAAKLDGVREAEVVDELAQHLEDRYQALRSSGVADAEAQRQSLEELNGNESLADELRKAARPLANAPIGSSNYFRPEWQSDSPARWSWCDCFRRCCSASVLATPSFTQR